VDSFTCTCIAPYWGKHCENDKTVCGEENMCPHDGECDVVTSTCQCTTPYINNCQHCVKGCVPDNATAECVDYDECSNNPNTCGGDSTLTCVNLKSRPCSFCCLDENGVIKFCGPDEPIISMSPEMENSEDKSTIIIISSVFGAFLLAVICVLVMLLVRQRILQQRNELGQNYQHHDKIPMEHFYGMCIRQYENINVHGIRANNDYNNDDNES